MIEGRYILETSDGIRIAYIMSGYKQPTLLFIHGWAATKEFWRDIIPIDEYRSVALDIRGHGESDKAKNYSLERVLLDINELLDNIGAKDIILIGHSMGGIIATKFALEYSEMYNIKKLILIATPPKVSYGIIRRMVLSFLLYVAPFILKKTFTPKTLYNPNEEILKFIYEESSKGSKKAYIAMIKAFDGIDITDDLKNIETQKIAMIPDDDKIVPTNIQLETYKRICDETIIIEESGHNVILEKKKEVATILYSLVAEELEGQ